MKHVTLGSSHGNLVVDSQGFPIGPIVEGLPRIVRVDFKEWKECYKTQEVPSWLDILDVGYWYNERGIPEYEEPDSFHRQMVNEEANTLVILK